MRVLLAQLAPRPGALLENVEAVRRVVAEHPAELYVFPELFLSGYRVGDRFHSEAVDPSGPAAASLGRLAQSRSIGLVVGAPVRHSRPGEVVNAALIADPQGALTIREKRFLPTFGPFEEGLIFTPGSTSEVVDLLGHRIGVQICYDAFFPEVSRELALHGAELLIVISAAPLTSRRLFDKVLPARAVENALPVVYVNRVGVEDGIVFGGGSEAFDARGELIGAPTGLEESARSAEGVTTVEIDLAEAARWRPFRPVLRDRSTRPHPGPVPDPKATPPGGEASGPGSGPPRWN